MPRVKAGVGATKRRNKTLKYTKGFSWGRKSKERAAKEALLHAWSHAFRGRKEKKRNARRLWSVKINAASRVERFPTASLSTRSRRKRSRLDRKILADLAEHEPKVFKKIVNWSKPFQPSNDNKKIPWPWDFFIVILSKRRYHF